MDSDKGALSADEAFWLLGDETRMAILRAVWEASEEPVSFTGIRTRVGSPDSGQFNYHLNKLKGHFLSTDDGGYRLTQAGREVVRAVMAGTITRRPATDPVAIDARCVECDGGLVARYDEYGHIECGDCRATVMWNEFPPAGLEGRTPAEFASTFDRWTRNRFRLAMDGICPNCAAEMSTEILDPGPEADDGIATNHRCTNCSYEARVPLFGHVLYHPAVVSFYYERGVDVVGMAYWQLQALAREFVEVVVSEEPWQAKISMESDGEELRVILDERLDVVDVERADI